MSIVFSDLQNALYDWAQARVPVGVPVIWYYPNAPRPQSTYISLNITTVNKVGWDYVPKPLDNIGNITLKGDREIVLTVQCYTVQPASAMQILENLRTSLQLESVKNQLNTSGIAYFSQESIIDLTSLVDSRFEGRAAMDLGFRIGQQYADVVGSIGEVEVTEEFFNQAEVLIFDKTYTIPPQ